ncbi:MAG: agmatine deiminase family protein [Verrucomicrobiota bacterium JB023]|nr:agmatine deiminase family protein [Verrucomicrobiota bacterium JB023]
MESAKKAGYRTPPEWARVDGIWMSWPVADQLWESVPRQELESVFADLVALISRFAEVRLCVRENQRAHVEEQFAAAGAQNYQIFGISTDDVWCRDHGATFLKHKDTGTPAVIDWIYNGWGGKFSHQLDSQVARRMAESWGLRRFQVPLVCEGGAIEVDGEGLCMTTESVLLNPNRNPNLKKGKVEQLLIESLGVDKVLWLKGGLPHDDTDGHADMVARFTKPGHVLAVEKSTETLGENAERLEAAGLEVRYLPDAGEVTEGVSGSYANFLIVNGAVIVPQYGKSTDEKALEIIRAEFPSHEVVGFDCSVLGLEGGGIHCLTQGQFA